MYYRYKSNFHFLLSICNHPGILAMFDQMNSWSGAGTRYYEAENAPWSSKFSNGETVGYLKSVDNLFTMRNAGHMVLRSQPAYGQDMFENFIAGTL